MNSSKTKTLAFPSNSESGERRASQPRGFALLACLLLVILLAAISLGLLMMVTAEGKAGGYNTQNNVAYHATEGAIEKMTTDLANSFTTIQAPQPSDIINLRNLVPPDTAAIKYKEYEFTPQVDPATGRIAANYHLISSGPNQGLYAQIMPIQLKATTQTGLNAEVTMVRNVEVALIPVFQFGVFSDSDLGFYSSPNLTFNGRVHTNQDIYLGVANGFTVKFNDKITAYGNVVRQVLPNGLPSGTNNNSGTVRILNAPNGCNGAAPNCLAMGITDGSVVGGPASAQNAAWPTISKGNFAGWILDGNYGQPGGTGAVKLVLPFTSGGPAGAVAAGTAPKPYEIIRRPVQNDTPATAQARLYNQAEIRVLLSDDPAELPGGANDPDNIRLANVQNGGTGPDFHNGVPTSVPGGLPALPGNASYTTYFAEASTAVPDPTNWTLRSTSSLPPDWPAPPAAPPAGHATLTPAGAPITAAGATSTWNLIDGYLRVEYLDASGNYNPITKEWLQLGFARGTLPPSGGPGTNPVNPNAILIFQKPADRNGDGIVDQVGAPHGNCNNGVACIDRPAETPKDPDTGRFEFGSANDVTSITRNNWYPINFYDAREGEARDQDAAASASCTVNGIMNAVELDVANLKRWLADPAGSGPNVLSNKDNGYILYFSDRRGMHPNSAGAKTGDSGLEDVVNAASTAGVPDQVLEPNRPQTPGHDPLSPEDTNQNGILDNYGAWNLGAAFHVNTGTSAGNLTPYGTSRIPDCFKNAGFATPPGRKNWVSGARHVIRLVNGSLGDVPTQPSGNGGFTVASENPVYILGNYNTSPTDPAWNGNFGTNQAPHAASAVIADAVTLLSNNWSDTASLLHPTGATGNRPGSTTYYRVAIAAGKNITFPNPPYATGVMYGFGTDGGVHNFLRFLEDWSGQTLHYAGSMVSLYYSTYATGTFKCCNDAVYHPPTRDYQFDVDFQDPSKLPPGTPMFRDINNLSFRQDFTPSTQAAPANQF